MNDTLFPVTDDFAPLRSEDAALLARLAIGAEIEIERIEHAACRRLAARGLVRISRQKLDPIATEATWFAERMP